ncbi:vWA domain-containing protein [Actinospica robiniae]|uniref:vWA domain-containing protein n=1 Tax=Actinospica robiniae TaxID=304901 RepID=UPI000408A424|nr:hypothetical protein [Actinospica robiniae]
MIHDRGEEPVVIAGAAKPKCLPTYLVLDTSDSMKPYTDLLNDSLKFVHRAAYHDPEISQYAHISIVVFNNEASVALPMSDISEVDRLPRVACGGITEYAKAFDLIRERIEVDVPNLLAAGLQVQRPVVFFMTDGLPTDGMRQGDKNGDERIWRDAFARLTDESWDRHPHVVAFGFGKARSSVIAAVATLQAFIAEQAQDQAESLRELFSFLVKSLSASATRGVLQVPEVMDGFRSVELEYMR